MSPKKPKAPTKAMRILLHELEHAVGSECYNGNIQNYGAWGEWEGEGRDFRYPLRYADAEGRQHRFKGRVPCELNGKGNLVEVPLTPEEMASARYAFGANELYVMRGMAKALEHLERRFGLSFEDLLKQHPKP